jgi:hypothetical protein
VATTTKERSRSSTRRSSDGRAERAASRGPERARSSQRGADAEIKATNLKGDDRKFLERNSAGLSKSTLRAKWIHSPEERADRPGQTLATRSREVIRAWATARDAVPATVGAGDEDARPRTLRFDFGEADRSGRLRPIDWDAWLETFERRKLVFLFQERRRNGDESNFFRLDSPEREEG